MKRRLLILSLLLLTATVALAQPQPTDRFAEFEGMRLHYQNYGVGTEAVVLIHGWSCDYSFWRLQAPELAKKWRVIAVDLPGHGFSDKPQIEYTQKLFARSLAAVMEHAGVEKTIVVGHSMGYGVARAFCAMYPGKVKGMIIVDGAFNVAPQNDQERQEYQQRVAGMKAMLSGDDYANTLKAFMEPTHDKSTSPEVRKEVIEKMLATPPHVGRSALVHCFDLSNWRAMQLNIPTLAIYSDRPNASPGMWPADLEQQLNKVHPVLELIMWKDAGHFYMLEKPSELNAAMVDFVTDVGLKKAQ